MSHGPRGLPHGSGSPSDHASCGPPDAQDRFVATVDLASNIVVVAGAGTGKTSLLVERALVALGSGKLTIDRLVAVTFTEKAAAELRERLVAALEELLELSSHGDPEKLRPQGEAVRAFDYLTSTERGGAGVSHEDLRERARRAFHDLDEAFVGTIHGFAAELLRRNPLEAGVDPYFEVDEGPRLGRLHEEQWPVFLARELGSGGERHDLWQHLLARLDPADLESLALSLLPYDVPLDKIEASGSERCRDRRLLAGPARQAATALRELLSERLNDSPMRWVKDAIPLLEQLELSGASGLARLAQSVEPSFWTKDPDLGKGVGPSLSREESERRIQFARKLLALSRRVDEQTVEYALAAVLPYAQEVRKTAVQAGCLSFEALLVLARDLLRDDPALLDAERERIGMLLIDEFQDTDPLQYDIVLFLAGRKGERERDPFRVSLHPGKLFIVGDPKQSIYRFRGADIVAYEKATARVLAEGGRRVVLRASFRSGADILGPLNSLFRPAFARQAPPLQPRYEPIEPARRLVAGGGTVPPVPSVTILSIDPAEQRSTAVRQRLREGQAIAREMKREHDRGRSWSEIALLLPAMTAGPLYARALHGRGIPFVMEGGKAFGARPEVQLMMALLQTVADPADPIGFLAVARSPLGAATDLELARFAAAGGRLPPRRHIDPEAFPGIARTARLIGELRTSTEGLPVDETVRRCIECTPILPIVAIGSEGAQRAANLRSLAAGASRIAREQGLSLDATVETLRGQIERDKSGETPLADEGLEAVRVLTVHRSKGLEFPVVFVADLRREDRPNGGQGERIGRTSWRETEGPAVLMRAGRSTLLSAAEVLRQIEEAGHELAEAVRCFYVACTRARERLFLVQSDPRGGGAWTSLLGVWGYIGSDGEYCREERLLDGQVAHTIVTGPDSDSESGEPAKAQITASAIGVIDGKRQEMPLKLTPLSEQGTYALSQQWPKEGRWVIEVRGFEKINGTPVFTNTLITAGPDGVDRYHAKSDMKKFTPAAIEAMLK